MFESLTFCLLVLLLVMLVKLAVTRRKEKRQFDKFKKTPGPLRLPFIGTLYQLIGTSLSESFRRIREIKQLYGNTMRLSFGNHLLVIISEPGSIERVIGSKVLVDRIELARIMLRDIFRDGLLISSGETWKIHRKIISSLFHNNCLGKFVEDFSKNSTTLADNLSKIPEETVFDTYAYALCCTMDIITETIMGTKSKAQLTMNTALADHYANILYGIGERARRPWLYLDFLYKKTKLWKMMQTKIESLYDYVEDILNERKEEYMKMEGNRESNKTKYLFDVLFESGEVSQKEIIEEAFNVMTAGSETTATVFSFVLVALGEYQEVQEKVMDEQWSIFHDDINRPVVYDDLQNMVYLEQVVKEIMRLYPPVCFLFRTAVEDVDLGNGFCAPKGSNVVALCCETHRDPTLYPDPDRFDPDRFSPESSYGRHPYAFVPFGGGRRFCIGYKYAMMELKTMLSVVLRRIKIVRAIDGLKEIEKHLDFSMVIHSSIGYKIHIGPR